MSKIPLPNEIARVNALAGGNGLRFGHTVVYVYGQCGPCASREGGTRV